MVYIIKWRASFKSLTSVTPLFMWSPTHRQNSSKSYWCLSRGLWKKNEFALCEVPSLIKSVLTIQVLIPVTLNLRNAYTYITHTHGITCVQQSTRYTRWENINEEHFFLSIDILDLYYFLPKTTSQFIMIHACGAWVLPAIACLPQIMDKFCIIHFF